MKIVKGVEIPIPEFVGVGVWSIKAEWKDNKITKLEFIRNDKV